MKKSGFFNQDKKAHAFLLFFSALTVDLLAAMLGFGGAQFIFHYSVDIDMFSSVESLIFSVSVVYFSLLVIICSYRNNQPNKLKALGYANLIMSLIPFVFNGIYYPFAYLIFESIADFANISDFFRFSDFTFFLAEVISLPICICCFVLSFKLKNVSEDKASKNISFCKISLFLAVIFIFITVLALYVCNTPISENFNYSVFEYIIK